MDPRLSKRKRQKATDGPLKSKFESVILDIASAFKKTKGFKHAQTKGNEREEPVRILFRDILPKSYGVVGGEIVDSKGQHSNQTDVIIYNHNANCAFVSGGSHVLAAEAPLMTMEVKSLLNSQGYEAIVKAAGNLRRLRPLGKTPEGAKTQGAPADDRIRYFHCIFGYSTDLSVDDWAQKEFARLNSECIKQNIPIDAIDRLYVADRGLIIPSKSIVLHEAPQSGDALMHLILHSINFCMREDRKRPQVDYVNYADTSTNAWQKLN